MNRDDSAQLHRLDTPPSCVGGLPDSSSVLTCGSAACAIRALLSRSPGEGLRPSRLLDYGGVSLRHRFWMFGPSRRAVAYVLSFLTLGTQRRYLAALEALEAFLEPLRIDFASLSEESQDYVVCDFIVDVIDEDGAPQACLDLLAALQKQYLGRRRYPAASHLLARWKSTVPVCMAEPMPLAVCCAMGVLFHAGGQRTVAMALLLAVGGLLRIGEALNLQLSDVLLPAEHHFGGCLILLLRVVKVAPPDASKAFVWDPALVRWATRYKLWRLRGPPGPFCNVSYATVVKWLNKATAALGFPVGTWRKHSARRGAATALSLGGLSLQQVMERGRWLSEKSARLYIAKGNVALLRMRHSVSSRTWQRVLSVAKLGDAVWTLPSTF